MEFDEIVKACEALGYKDKFRLAQLLIQLGRKEEETEHPQKRLAVSADGRKNAAANDLHSIQYVMERLGKLRPGKKKGLINSIEAMYQFRGGISEEDQVLLIAELQKKKFLEVDADGKVVYL